MTPGRPSAITLSICASQRKRVVRSSPMQWNGSRGCEDRVQSSCHSLSAMSASAIPRRSRHFDPPLRHRTSTPSAYAFRHRRSYSSSGEWLRARLSVNSRSRKKARLCHDRCNQSRRQRLQGRLRTVRHQRCRQFPLRAFRGDDRPLWRRARKLPAKAIPPTATSWSSRACSVRSR